MTGRVIGRQRPASRRELVVGIVREVPEGSTVAVEHRGASYLDTETVICTIVGFGTGRGGESLVVTEVARHRRLPLVIPIAHLVRVRWAHDPSGQRRPDPSVYELGDVIAGPALKEAQK